MPTSFAEWTSLLDAKWSFIAQVTIIWFLGQVFKKRVWTKARADRSAFHRFMRDTLPLHPLAVGGLWGALYPLLPAVDLVTSRGGAIVQGVLAGTVSVAGFTALEHYAERKRIGWLLKFLRSAVPDQSIPPSPPRKAPPPLGRVPRI